MTVQDECLQQIGDIAIQWSKVEAELRELLWLYVGTDRPTFNLLFAKASGDHIEKQLKKIAIAKEVDEEALRDVQTALSMCKVHRANRNIILHRLSADHIEDAEALLPKLREAREAILSFASALSIFRTRLTAFLAAREALETPDGLKSGPDEDEHIPTYASVEWPEPSTRIEVEDF